MTEMMNPYDYFDTLVKSIEISIKYASDKIKEFESMKKEDRPDDYWQHKAMYEGAKLAHESDLEMLTSALTYYKGKEND